MTKKRIPNPYNAMSAGNRETITNAAGFKLAAVSFIPPEYSHILVVCHGFKGGKENSGRIFAFASRLNELNLGVIAFDFSGSGDSEGEFTQITLTGQVQDLITIIDFAEQKYARPLLLLGRSFGGSTVAASVLQREQVSAYIFWSTPVRLQETFSRFDPPTDPAELETFERERQVRLHLLDDFKRHDMAAYLSKIKDKPVLVVHGSADQVVPLDNVAFFKQYLPQADYEIVPSADHGFYNHTKIRDDITIAWLRKILNKE